jgi:hypothetical protein
LADDKLKQMSASKAPPPTAPGDTALAQKKTIRTGGADAADQEKLFQQFLEWSKKQKR